MYEAIIMFSLLSGYILTPTADSTSTAAPAVPISSATAEEAVPTPMAFPVNSTGGRTHSKSSLEEGKVGRKKMEHVFSEPVMILIIFGVLAAIIAIILLFGYLIGNLTKKSSLNVQPMLSNAAEIPLSSVETEDPEK